MTNKPLTAERVRELLHYEPTTGHFRWRVTRGGTARAGAVAGNVDRLGYGQIRIDGRRYMASRLAWLYMHGAWPDRELDHRDLNKRNNAIANLRPVTRSQNMRNRCMQKDNKTGYKGVSRYPSNNRYRAIIGVNQKLIFLGAFDTAQEAHRAYCKASAELHGEYGRTQ